MGKRVRVSKRLRNVITTFMMKGVEVPFRRMRVAHCASLHCRMHCTWQRWTGRRKPAHHWPQAVRDALVELGPVFVKVGQILSVRSDLVPPEYASAFRELQSQVPAVPFDAVREMLETELGAPLDETFSRLETEPLAAGSIAQVYEGELADGRRVAVKVKRPGVDARVTEDLDILVWLAERLEKYMPSMRSYHPVNAARELRRYTLQELDFRIEAGICTRVRTELIDRDDLKIPEVHFASKNVVIMEFVDCFPADDFEKLDEHGIDRTKLVRQGLHILLAQIFEVGAFHADPHPGNMQVAPDGRSVMLDFGIFGQFNERLLRNSVLLMWTSSRGDVDLTSYFMLRMAKLEPDADIAAFRRGVEECYEKWLGASVAEYSFGQLLFDEFSLAARHGVMLPADMVLFAKAIVTIEGIALSLDPEFEAAKEAAPYLERLKQRVFSTDRMREALERSLPLWLDVAERLPVGLAELVDRRYAAGGQPTPPAPGPRGGGGSSAVFPASLVLSGALLLSQHFEPLWSDMSVPGAGLLGLGLVLGLVSRTATK